MRGSEGGARGAVSSEKALGWAGGSHLLHPRRAWPAFLKLGHTGDCRKLQHQGGLVIRENRSPPREPVGQESSPPPAPAQRIFWKRGLHAGLGGSVGEGSCPAQSFRQTPWTCLRDGQLQTESEPAGKNFPGLSLAPCVGAWGRETLPPVPISGPETSAGAWHSHAPQPVCHLRENKKAPPLSRVTPLTIF